MIFFFFSNYLHNFVSGFPIVFLMKWKSRFFKFLSKFVAIIYPFRDRTALLNLFLELPFNLLVLQGAILSMAKVSFWMTFDPVLVLRVFLIQNASSWSEIPMSVIQFWEALFELLAVIWSMILELLQPMRVAEEISLKPKTLQNSWYFSTLFGIIFETGLQHFWKTNLSL